MRIVAMAEELIAARDLPPLDLTCVFHLLPPAHASFTRICAAHSLIAIR